MMQMLNWQAARKWGKRIVIAFSVLYVIGVIEKSLPRPPQCPMEQHSFQGQKFDIELCLNIHDNSERVGFFVYSSNGGLLAWRGATFAQESRLNYMAIEDTMIRYSDASLNADDLPADCVLNMPPSWIDWLDARLPGGIPGVDHCGKASREVVKKALDQWDARVEEAERKKPSAKPTEP